MEIDKNDLELKLSNNVRKRYITQVKGNIYDSSKLRDLKLKRNWILGKIIEDSEELQVRNYGNLVMEVRKDNWSMTRIYNNFKYSKCFNEDAKESNIHKEDVEKILDIDKLKQEEKVIYLGGYKLSNRFYKTYVIENNTYKDYKDLLDEAVDVIRYGVNYHSFNDKDMFKYKGTIVTLTGNIEITNVRWVGESNE